MGNRERAAALLENGRTMTGRVSDFVSVPRSGFISSLESELEQAELRGYVKGATEARATMESKLDAAVATLKEALVVQAGSLHKAREASHG